MRAAITPPISTTLAAYQIDKNLLVFADVEHSNRLDSPTFELITKVYNRFQFDVLTVEGFETSSSGVACNIEPLLNTQRSRTPRANSSERTFAQTLRFHHRLSPNIIQQAIAKIA